MVLAGYADVDAPVLMIPERPYGEAEHVVWSVPPQAAAGLVDRADDRDWANLSTTRDAP